MEIGGNLGFDNDDMEKDSKRKRMVLDSFSEELPGNGDIEVELLRKRMDGFSTRLTLAFFFFVALFAVFLALAYFYIEREIENLKKEQAELLSPDHIFAQKFDQLSGMGDALTEEIKRQTDALETARLDLKKNADALASRIKSLEQSGELKQAKDSLKKLEASQSTLSAKLSEMEKNIASLAAIPARMDEVQKVSAEAVEKQKNLASTLQVLQRKQQSFAEEIALFPIDSVQKSELQAAVRRQDSERANLETRLTRQINQMHGGSSTTRQETLTE